MAQLMKRIHQIILKALRPGNQTAITTPEFPNVSFLIYVSERSDVVSITTELDNNPSTIRIGINSVVELDPDKEIKQFNANIAVKIYGTLFKEMPVSTAGESSSSFASMLSIYRLCIRFTEESL